MAKASELKELSLADLQKREAEFKEELFNLRFQLATGQLENTARIAQVRKDIARVKVYQGRVVSDKMDKTITVAVDTYVNHAVYGKRVKYTKKFKAHDENNSAKMNDIVQIMETRPLSATKHFRLVKIVEEAVIL